ncbi:PSP1 domain-containing protein [Thermodesulforhabdus norvegica]|uniref:Cell fate regulator YaaT, PSP1 superfamily (Controls sporulation, competence, biofilm development) n=1 Tax=Thermodesulforhabdus norvegica TaxID=39841 RepID=A0A1I4U8F6_9BACT|nr:stage 0 sporulation family protein [Thermodesulforhabdus norvegica]SFM85217.1 Cell fate regulator YaaT, PSP1 superfamily (controls sporulation, competence, biofilm development) [Thermodesulforhabdus norvegica]
MKRIVGVRFRERGFVYHFDCGPWDVKKGDYVIAESPEGPAVGVVVEDPVPLEESGSRLKIKTIERPATDEELEKYRRDRDFERYAREYCLERIRAHGLPMKLVDVELLFDGSKIIFYFTADGRVDFRELLKDLVRHLRMRIELRQIGVRNHAAMVGGLGMCGRPVCCAQFLKKFHPVSIKMAKEQNLSLNPLKISGACGRLMCCLQYESEVYGYLKQGLPRVGKRIETEWGSGKVIRQNVLERTITVELDEGRLVDIVYPMPDNEDKMEGEDDNIEDLDLTDYDNGDEGWSDST